MAEKVLPMLLVAGKLIACNGRKKNKYKMDNTNLYKVVMVFNLTKGSAEEELKRSVEETGFPNMLAQQHGFIEMELVKINEEKTMSIQTWETEEHWWAALGKVKNLREKSGQGNTRENILISRELLNGYVKVHKIRKAGER